MFSSSCLPGFFLILFHVSVAYAVGSADSKSTDSFAASRERIIKWASGFVAKKRNSITGFAKPEVPFAGIYHYGDERLILGKTPDDKECALHLGKRLESGEWVFSFYLEDKRRELDSISMIRENLGSGDGVLLFEGELVIQSQRAISNTYLDLHTTASGISLLSLIVYTTGSLGEESLSLSLDDDDNIIQVAYRFIDSFRIRDGRRVDPVTCRFYYVS
jgi:hypothetical protein